MMISAATYINDLKDKSYSELLKERESLLSNIYYLEKQFENSDNQDYEDGLYPTMMFPSFGTQYQMNCEYLIELIKLIKVKFKGLDIF